MIDHLFLKYSSSGERFTLDDDNLLSAVIALGRKYNKLNNVPITISLKEQIVTSFNYQTSKYNDFINGIMLQLLTLHSPLDLKIVSIY